MTATVQTVIEQFRHRLDPTFPITTLEAHPGLPAPKTIRNLRAARQLPDRLFLRDQKRVLLVRDEFLAWWGARLTEDHAI